MNLSTALRIISQNARVGVRVQLGKDPLHKEHTPAELETLEQQNRDAHHLILRLVQAHEEVAGWVELSEKENSCD